MEENLNSYRPCDDYFIALWKLIVSLQTLQTTISFIIELIYLVNQCNDVIVFYKVF